MTTENAAALLELDNVAVHFQMDGGLFSRKKAVRAVDGISFQVSANETLGLVGESGCGKSTTGAAILQLVALKHGEIRFDGRAMGTANGAEIKALRRRVQMVFQDAYAALDPRMTIADTLAEPLRVHSDVFTGSRTKRILELLDLVSLPKAFLGRYPHELSGGQLQRIGIARALAVRPDFIVCDEPVSALDVSIQAQIVNLLDDIQSEFGVAMLFISHDLSVVRHLSHRVAVMYLGRIVEIADAETLYKDPRHPYTQALLSAVPIPDPPLERRRAGERIILEGDVPSPTAPPSGCRFHTRCPMAIDACKTVDPKLERVGAPGHAVACIRATETRPDRPKHPTSSVNQSAHDA